MAKENVSIQEVLQEKKIKERNKKYQKYVKQVTPTHPMLPNLFHAFWVGGIICVIGQAIMNFFLNRGADELTAGAATSIVLVLISVILTGFEIYPKIAKYAGAGTVVPITGFANSVASPAIEFKKEGQVFGIGCKIFTIAGPVILYGIFSSWVCGLIYWIFTL